jgi:alkenylglycerophosphocholine/alkenylglycerophosphoethanolamine hydrolase
VRAVLIVLTLVSALSNWCSRLPAAGARGHRLEQITKPLTTMLVIAIAATSGAPQAEVVIAVVALTMCLAGDVALMPIVDNFVLGLAAFLVGHVVFIALFVRFGLRHPSLASVAAAGGLGLAVGIGGRIVRGARVKDVALTLPVCAYLVVIIAMMVVGWATGRGWVVAGSLLFVVSDSILGWEEFVDRRPWMPVAVMITYHAAIVSLALSL